MCSILYKYKYETQERKTICYCLPKMMFIVEREDKRRWNKISKETNRKEN